MNTKHTAEAWIYTMEPSLSSIVIEPACPNSLVVAHVPIADEENARLIASAPELLSALFDLCGWMDLAEDLPEAQRSAYMRDLDNARAVIAKATGR